MATTEEPVEIAERELRGYLAVLRRRWMVIAVTVFSMAAAAVSVSVVKEPEYRASVDLLLRTTPSERIIAGRAERAAAEFQRELTNEIEVIESDVVREVVHAATKRPVPRDAVSASIASEGSDVVRLSATSGDPRVAAQLVNDYAQAYVAWRRQQRVDDLLAAGREIQAQIDALKANLDEISAPLADLERRISGASGEGLRDLVDQRDALAEQLERRTAPIEDQMEFYREQLDQLRLTAKLAESGGIQLLSQAEPPDEPVSPAPERDVPVAVAVGLLVGLALALAFDFLDDSVKDKGDLERASAGLPVLALIPKVGRRRREGRLFPLTLPASNVAEAYRALRTSLEFIADEHPLHTVQFTSATAGDGKTTTVANLAAALAEAGDHVVAICCDLRRPRLHEFFEADNRIGLTSVIIGEAAPAKVVQRVHQYDTLFVVASGPPPHNPSELLGTGGTEKAIEAIGSRVDVVLLDTPPVLPVADGLVLSRLADATVLVVAANRTSKRQLRRAIELLRQAKAPLVGTVLTEATGEERYGYDEAYWRSKGRDVTNQPSEQGGRRRRRRVALRST